MTSTNRSTRGLLVVLPAAAALLLGACGDGDDGSTESTMPTVASTASPTPEAPATTDPVPATAAPATGDLARPDPGIGDGFEQAMIEGYVVSFGLTEAEATCLTYEVTMWLEAEAGRYELSPDEAALEVGDRCGLDLG